jgi:hypothetical protein
LNAVPPENVVVPTQPVDRPPSMAVLNPPAWLGLPPPIAPTMHEPSVVPPKQVSPPRVPVLGDPDVSFVPPAPMEIVTEPPGVTVTPVVAAYAPPPPPT